MLGDPSFASTIRACRAAGQGDERPSPQGRWPLKARRSSWSAGRARQCAGAIRQRRRRRKDPPVTCTLHVAWDDRLTRYDFGPGHPLAPIRVELTVALARAFGVLDTGGVTVAVPEP